MILVLGVWAFVRALFVSSAAVSLENVLCHQLAVSGAGFSGCRRRQSRNDNRSVSPRRPSVFLTQPLVRRRPAAPRLGPHVDTGLSGAPTSQARMRFVTGTGVRPFPPPDTVASWRVAPTRRCQRVNVVGLLEAAAREGEQRVCPTSGDSLRGVSWRALAYRGSTGRRQPSGMTFWPRTGSAPRM
jgi:hypothetical protein